MNATFYVQGYLFEMDRFMYISLPGTLHSTIIHCNIFSLLSPAVIVMRILTHTETDNHPQVVTKGDAVIVQ